MKVHERDERGRAIEVEFQTRDEVIAKKVFEGLLDRGWGIVDAVDFLRDTMVSEGEQALPSLSTDFYEYLGQ